MTPLKFGLVGAGFIGRAHALALNAASVVFASSDVRVTPYILAEIDEAFASSSARDLHFERWTTDWREAVDASDAIIIAVPSNRHLEIASYAASKGKPVLCEKPVGRSSREADTIAAAASAAGVPNGVGFTYLRAPLVRLAKDILESGRIGRPVHFAGRHNEDYLADARAPHTWRLSAEIAGRAGALGDLGYHILSIARFLCGQVSSVAGLARTFHPERPRAAGSPDSLPVDNEDYAGALLEFAGGAAGVIECSRLAHGRKMGIGFELVCERGTIAFDGERMNELQLYEAGENTGGNGFRTILLGPEHPHYGAFLPAPGHGIGFNDLKTIEIAEFVRCLRDGGNLYPDLGEAAKISRICETIIASAATGRRIPDPEDFQEHVQ